jgi:tRNA (guanine37-N1)-methyltransferase
VLLCGDHGRIEEYRFIESVRETLYRRPELLDDVEFSATEKKQLHRAGLDQALIKTK